ncbi:29383_t:CDS:1, partial [Gigaspora margarita]
LVDKKGEVMITWRKFRAMRAETQRGQKARWFETIEKSIIDDIQSRKLKNEFRSQQENVLSMKIKIASLTNDKRKREWVVIDKENNKIIIGKVHKKKKSQVLVSHWTMREVGNSEQKLVECTSCDQNQKENTILCQQWVKKRKVLGVLP